MARNDFFSDVDFLEKNYTFLSTLKEGMNLISIHAFFYLDTLKI